jgi:LmbE family N-acetylglucosaminyl deacetylase
MYNFLNTLQIIKLRFLFCAILLVFSTDLLGQKPKRYNSSEIQLMLEKLQVLGSVLYVAAHPDDENTAIITYFANERKVHTAYFSFTRGDGGQNLIGSEIGEKLGLIRTNELLQARRIDRGEQFFSRAVDFGYSKHPDETFNIWDRQEVLGDLVWVIRKFRPDVIITRFNQVPGTTHGHHTASAILASEAMEQAGDPTKYPEQLTFVAPWQPESLYWNAYFWRRSEYMKDTTNLLRVDVGKYNKLLGMSYSEIAALSRSSHKSQGFGATGARGKRIEFLQHEKGYDAKNDIFESLDVTWNRVAEGAAIEKKITQIQKKFQPADPSVILNDLCELKAMIEGVEEEFWRKRKINEVNELIYAVTGLYLEVKTSNSTACPGDWLDFEVEAINRSKAKVVLNSVRLKEMGVSVKYATPLKENIGEGFQMSGAIPSTFDYSQPYWLKNPNSSGMFEVNEQQLIGKPINEPALSAEFELAIEGEPFFFTKPVVYKENDPVKGEVYRPFVVTPPVFASMAGDVIIFSEGKTKRVAVEVRAGRDDISGLIRLSLPETWRVTPDTHVFSIDKKGEKRLFYFEVVPPKNQEVAYAQPVVSFGGQDFSYNYTEIDYDHIPFQVLFQKSQSKFVNLDLVTADERIGYVVGAGDKIPDVLQQIGYEVDFINEIEFTKENLDRYSTIVLGIRALNTVDRLKFDMPQLFAFVERGGNLVVQYNTSHNLVTNEIAPFPLSLSRGRVTVEEAPVAIINPAHEILNYPNKITEADFEDWVQERGLYFPDSWDAGFVPVLSSHDPGEKPLQGGLLVAKYGKGQYVYSGYSWFRELPAGVPGAYRIFVNLITNRQ